MDRFLTVIPNWRKRTVICVLLSLPALLTSVPLLLKLCSILFVVAMTGTTRVSRVSGPELVTEMFVAFFPYRRERCKLKFIVEIESRCREDTNATALLLLGFVWVMDRVMQFVWPWMAGEYELWVSTARDRRILAWRGNHADVFQANLQTLISATGATVRRV